MNSGIYLCYVPKKYIANALIDQVEWLIDNEYEYNECVIIDNISKGYRMYPHDLKSIMCRCNTLDIINTICNNINKQKTAIILNDFDIDMDDIKDIYADIVDDKNITIIIFNSIKSNTEEKLMIRVKKNLKGLDENSWSELKLEILEHIDDYTEKNCISNNNIENEPIKEYEDKDLKELLDLFSKEIDFLEDKEEEEFDRFALKTIKESYTYQKKKDLLTISLTTGNDLIFSDGIEQILVKHNMLNHLIETIEHIRGQK